MRRPNPAIVAFVTFVPVTALFAADSSSQSVASASTIPQFATLTEGSKHPEQIARRDVVWQFFIVVRTLENSGTGQGSAFLETELGMEPQTAQSLIAYIDGFFAQYAQFAKSQLSRFCSDPVSKADAPSIVSRLAADEDASAAWRDSKVSGLSAVLDAKSLKKLDHWANAHVRNHVSVLTTDSAKLLSSPQAVNAIPERINVLCAGAPH
jgi:hypothetical protein